MIIFAYIFIVLIIIIAIFQAALVFGAPLGELTMGGRFPGKLPRKMRIAAAVQILVLLCFGVITASKAGIAFEQFYRISKIGIWVIFAFFIFGTVMNLSSPSRKEKLVMGPANILALVCSFFTAIG